MFIFYIHLVEIYLWHMILSIQQINLIMGIEMKCDIDKFACT
jgi:hypothetical protein